MKYQDIDIKELLRECSSILELKNTLYERGLKFGSWNKLEKILYSSWQKANKDLIKEIEKEPIMEIKRLPYTEVVCNGVTCRIHGLAHNQGLIKMSEKTKEFILNEIKKYENPPTEDYLLEEGFAEILNLDKSKEMKGCFYRAYDRIRISEFFKLLLKEMFLSIPLLLSIKLNINNGECKYFYKSLEDPNYLPKAREIYSLLKKLPEPLNLELKKLKGGEDKLFVYFSEEMAKFILNYIKNNEKLKILHIITGFEHESEISYYLQLNRKF